MPVAEYNAFGVRAEEAIAHLTSKLDLPSKYWDQYEGNLHGRSFSVAGATKLDLVSDFHGSINKMLEEGKTITDFRKDFDKIVTDHGWSYKGKRGWRTNVIFQTNMRTSRMAGLWHQIERNKTKRPFLMYVVIDDNKLRAQHREWGVPPTVLPVDDSFWTTHYPPNGWGCRCTVRSLSKRDMKAEKLEVRKPDLPEPTERINPKTGEVYGKVPVGIDTGWDHNVGKADLGADKALGAKIMAMKPDIRKEVIDHNYASFADAQNDSWKFWLAAVSAHHHTKGHTHSVGLLSNKVIDQLDNKGKLPESALITVDESRLKHLVGDHKDTDKQGQPKAIPDDILDNLPMHMHNYQVALWDKGKKNLILVMDLVGKKRARSAITINFGRKRKGELVNSVRSLGLVEESSLTDRNKYEILDGEW